MIKRWGPGRAAPGWAQEDGNGAAPVHCARAEGRTSGTMSEEVSPVSKFPRNPKLAQTCAVVDLPRHAALERGDAGGRRFFSLSTPLRRAEIGGAGKGGQIETGLDGAEGFYGLTHDFGDAPAVQAAAEECV